MFLLGAWPIFWSSVAYFRISQWPVLPGARRITRRIPRERHVKVYPTVACFSPDARLGDRRLGGDVRGLVSGMCQVPRPPDPELASLHEPTPGPVRLRRRRWIWRRRLLPSRGLSVSASATRGDVWQLASGMRQVSRLPNAAMVRVHAPAPSDGGLRSILTQEIASAIRPVRVSKRVTCVTARGLGPSPTEKTGSGIVFRKP